ncbi:MAG: nickel pincer cofactor biosynthesis protein LarB [Armatimonadetes bacterium]|nr:nickel pincer cofactor biosynthesis protein LarB [Armatimonadota bacterium]MDE2205604.1 nickel pincer cofactor biosynthesis protein LarB [Armatimonadota bacterium]
MDQQRIRELLEAVRSGELAPDAALDRLRALPFEDIGFARPDSHRALRTGFPEVVYCESKTPEQVCAILRVLARDAETVMATRVSSETAALVQQEFADCRWHPSARILVLSQRAGASRNGSNGSVLVVSAGTSDEPVAEEAAVTAETMGARVQRLYDVGVAGIHRLFEHVDQIFAASVIVVVAGMDGALASVIGGLAACPVVAVPTSVGYGASFGGVAALLSMLNSCAAGVAVVNIDNGFGAGCLAVRILRTAAEALPEVAVQSPPVDG